MAVCRDEASVGDGDPVRVAREIVEDEPHRFTTFIALEWTALVKGNNLHRNVILRDGPKRALRVLPYTTTPPIGSRDPRDLWKWMANYERTTGGNVLAIPHNGNLSNGMMFAMQDDFDDGKPLDKAYAQESHVAKFANSSFGERAGCASSSPFICVASYSRSHFWPLSHLALASGRAFSGGPVLLKLMTRCGW